jgi:hypothetical protein
MCLYLKHLNNIFFSVINIKLKLDGYLVRADSFHYQAVNLMIPEVRVLVSGWSQNRQLLNVLTFEHVYLLLDNNSCSSFQF